MKTIHISPNFNRQFTSPHLPRNKNTSNQNFVTNSAHFMYFSPPNGNTDMKAHEKKLIPPLTHFQHPCSRERTGKQNCSPIFQPDTKELPNQSTHKKQSSQIKRPLTSYTTEVNSKNAHAPLAEINQEFKITPFIQDDASLMNVFSPKLTKSIIMKEDEAKNLKMADFKKLRFLGKGKFGEVYLVIHKPTAFICALKIIAKKVVVEQGVQNQLAKELRIHNSLKHPNIIDFYGFFQDVDNFYVLIEYASQGCLLGKLKDRNRLQQEEIKPIAKDLVSGIRYLHRMGIIHRDIKPQNVIMQFGSSKICDFGWANSCYGSQLCKSYCGTPLYLAPEMVKKEQYSSRIDIWALGLVLYELLVGRGPFSIWSQNDLPKILDTSVSYPPYIDKTHQIEQFIGHCLEKSPSLRYSPEQLLQQAFLTKTPQTSLNYDFYEQCRSVLSFY